MSSINAPFGLRPAFHPSGLDRAQALANGIASVYNTDILKGQPVKLNSSGVLVVAAAGDTFQGALAALPVSSAAERSGVCDPPRSAQTRGAAHSGDLQCARPGRG